MMTSEPELRGMAFANYAAESLLARYLIQKGFSVEKTEQPEEKDFGFDEETGPIIGYFDVGYVTFRKGNVTYSLYQSRFSDNWAFDGPHGRTELTARLADRVDMNNAVFVDALMKEIGE